MPQRTYFIDQLIINSPYDEPAEHWSYDRESRLHTRTAGRRSAGYVVASPGSRSFDDPGVFHELPLVNKIRTTNSTSCRRVCASNCDKARCSLATGTR